MDIWNVNIQMKDGEKNLHIYDDDSPDSPFDMMKAIMSKLISKYTDVKSFFDISVTSNSYLYKTPEITVTIMNNHTGYIEFFKNSHSSVIMITITKRPIFLLSAI